MLFLLELDTFSCPWKLLLPEPWNAGIYTSSPLVLRLSELDGIIPSTFLVLQFADGELWGFSASKPDESIPIINLLLVLFPWRLLIRSSLLL